MAGVNDSVEQAEKLEAEVIVVGSHGRGKLFDLVVGSVSAGVIRKAQVPVLVVANPNLETPRYEIRRIRVNETIDEPSYQLISDEELEAWKAKDPIPRFEAYLLAKRLLTKKKIATIAESVQTQIQAAVDNAEARMKTMGDPLDMFAHAYAETPPHLAAQKEELAAELAADEKEGADG